MVLVIAFFVGSCAPQTEVVKLYEDPARVSKTYKRLLVVVVSSDFDLQQQFEDEIVQGLRRQQVDATPGHKYFDTSGGLLQEDIDQAGQAFGADGIVVTHIVSLDTSVKSVEGRADIESTCRGGDPVDFFLYDHKVIREPDELHLAHTVTVVTNLYEAASRSRIWTIQSTCFEKSSMPAVLVEEATAIVRQLRIDKLI
jgi:hypothetical protein